MRSLLCPKRLRSLLLDCGDKAALLKIHAFVVSTGISVEKNNINGLLIGAYERNGCVSLARKVFDKLSHRGVAAYNSMITGYSRKDAADEVLRLYSQMIAEGVRPDSSTFTVTLKACVTLMDMETGAKVWSKALDCGYENDVFVCSSVLNLYVKCGKMDRAEIVFDKMTRKDLVCWTTMVTGFAQIGQPWKAIALYRKMQKEGFEGDAIVMVGLIQACANIGSTKTGLSIHGFMIRKGVPLDVVVHTSLIDMYAKTGLLEVAARVFYKMKFKNVITWAALISGFAQNGCARNVLELLVEMQRQGFKPNSACLLSSFLACSQVGSLKLGKAIHGYIVKRHDLDQVSATALIDMYSKCGALGSSRDLFDRTDSKDLVSWNTMISSYGVHGRGEEALSVFLQMTETNLKPDDATFAALLSALGHSGLVQEGEHWFSVMVNGYQIKPTEKHLVCMVDLMARAGRVKEALQLINSVNTEPGLAVWVALLSGCINHRKFDVGDMAAEKILELNSEDPGIHVLVSNFYAMAKKWDAVAGVRGIMKKIGMNKVPGYSLVEVNGELHGFVTNDESHHEYENILHVLDQLDYEMRASETILHDLERGREERKCCR